jgi:hypothetical protein
MRRSIQGKGWILEWKGHYRMNPVGVPHLRYSVWVEWNQERAPFVVTHRSTLNKEIGRPFRPGSTFPWQE